MVKSINLTDFRNFKKKPWLFDKLTIVIGPNASGKTNILEALYLLSTGKSFRRYRGRNGQLWGRYWESQGKSGTTVLEAVVTRGFGCGER